MVVENTKILLDMLWDGKIDFALLEGHFNEEQFESRLISSEPFIAVCSPNNKDACSASTLKDLLGQNLILREPGSGTRDVLEHALYHQNYSIESFKHRLVIGSMDAIKYLCHENIGITFMYREATKKELLQGYLKEIPISDFVILHPFSFVYLKSCPDKEKIEYWYEKFTSLRNS